MENAKRSERTVDGSVEKYLEERNDPPKSGCTEKPKSDANGGQDR